MLGKRDPVNGDATAAHSGVTTPEIWGPYDFQGARRFRAPPCGQEGRDGQNAEENENGGGGGGFEKKW